ncbi:MAG: SocA family protein [Dysgonamonadaceae bacterium]|nr:SocA family protein [Dysgonamonadaceae bacterium]
MNSYSKDTIKKLGNAMIYIAERVSDPSKTKLLKLLYLLEEESVKQNKIPFFGIPFEVWQAGPVAKDVFIDLDIEPRLLSKYISIKHEDNATYISPKTSFNDDEFSDNDIAVMEYVIEKFGKKTARQLVVLLHNEGSAWHHVAKENGLLEAFKRGITNSSDKEIDFTYYLSGCDAEWYRECINFRESIEPLK